MPSSQYFVVWMELAYRLESQGGGTPSYNPPTASRLYLSFRVCDIFFFCSSFFDDNEGMLELLEYITERVSTLRREALTHTASMAMADGTGRYLTLLVFFLLPPLFFYSACARLFIHSDQPGWIRVRGNVVGGSSLGFSFCLGPRFRSVVFGQWVGFSKQIWNSAFSSYHFSIRPPDTSGESGGVSLL